MIKKHKERIEKIKNEMKSLSTQENWDIETTHVEADDLLCELLVILGYSGVVNDFGKIEKWYA